MPDSLEERVSFFEGRVSDQSDVLKEIRQSLVHLDQKVDRFRDELGGRINALDQRVSGRLEELGQRIDSIDGKIDHVSDRLGQRILWLFGVQVTVLVVVIGAFYRMSG
jgi:uncharacterized coiled-coil protein SlyX